MSLILKMTTTIILYSLMCSVFLSPNAQLVWLSAALTMCFIIAMIFRFLQRYNQLHLSLMKSGEKWRC